MTSIEGDWVVHRTAHNEFTLWKVKPNRSCVYRLIDDKPCPISETFFGTAEFQLTESQITSMEMPEFMSVGDSSTVHYNESGTYYIEE